MSHSSPEQRCFLRWDRANRYRLERLWNPPVEHGRLITARLRDFPRNLELEVRPLGVSIADCDRDRLFDWLYDVDIEIVSLGPSRCRCGLCPADDPTEWPSSDRLLIEHLYEPMARWVAAEVLPAEYLSLLEMTGLTWATTRPARPTADMTSIVVQRRRS